MESMALRCVQCGKKYGFEPWLYTCPDCNSSPFTNLLVESANPLGWLGNRASKTPCYQIPSLSKETSFSKLYVKDETFNLFGTVKDRRSAFLAEAAKSLGFNQLFCVTGGNIGKSLASFCQRDGMECITVSHDRIPRKTKHVLRKKSAQLILQDLQTNQSIWTTEKIRKEFPNAFDATSANPLSFKSYQGLAQELAALEPDALVVPLGTGELFCGLCQGLGELGLKTRVAGVSVSGKNVVGKAVREGKEEAQIESFQESRFDKISSAYTPLLPVILHYIRKGHSFIELAEIELEKAVFEYQPYFEKSIEPSSFSVFAALEHLKGYREKKVVCILTGSVHADDVIRH